MLWATQFNQFRAISTRGTNLCAVRRKWPLWHPGGSLVASRLFNTKIQKLAAAAANFWVLNAASYHCFYDLPKLKIMPRQRPTFQFC